MVENTTQRDPALHVLGVISEGTDGYIMGMEAAGQRQLVGSTKLPTEAPWDAMAELGFVRGDDVPGDNLFCEATLPDGWRKDASDHAMWSYVLDERGVRRLAVFYKAAFYDRRAFARFERPGFSLATEALYGDEPPALPPMWDVLDEDERADFWAGVDDMVRNIDRHPDIYGRYQPRVTALLALR